MKDDEQVLYESPAAKHENDSGSQSRPSTLTKTYLQDTGEWELVSLDQLFFHSLFQLGCQFKSNQNLAEQETTSSDLYALTFQT